MDNVCVYGSSSDAIDQVYLDSAYLLGQQLADAGLGLVFGAGKIGVMGQVARGVHSRGGYVKGIIPKFMDVEGIPYRECDELIWTNTMRERKQLMEDAADAFITAAGGIGTFEEFFEILTLKQLSQHKKAIVLLNTNGYYDDMQRMMELSVEQKFAKPSTLQMYHVANSVPEAMEYLKQYEYIAPGKKWFG